MRYIHLFCLFISIHSLQAHAVLGEKFTEGAKYSASSLNSYTKYESAQEKLTLHQFSGASGKVFAVAWQGKQHPDLREVLGAQFEKFQEALREARKSRRGHSPIEIDHNGLHVELGGNSRNMFGRIWLNGQIPAGVNTNDIH